MCQISGDNMQPTIYCIDALVQGFDNMTILLPQSIIEIFIHFSLFLLKFIKHVLQSLGFHFKHKHILRVLSVSSWS